jgi:hypothetical protein
MKPKRHTGRLGMNTFLDWTAGTLDGSEAGGQAKSTDTN